MLIRIIFVLISAIVVLCQPVLAEGGVASSAEAASPLGVGAKVPAGELRNSAGELVQFAELIKAKPSLLIFYRGGWCPFCNAHLGKIASIQTQLSGLGYQTLAISPDKPEKLIASAEKLKDAKYTLLSDSSMQLSKAFGLAFKVPQELVSKYKNEYNIDIEADSGEKHHLLPVPAAYLVNTAGVITYAYTNADYKVRVGTGELLEAAKGE